MNEKKKEKLEAAGWSVGSATDFLELSEAEEAIVAMKLKLASHLRNLREQNNLTQSEAAEKIGSSQSRVAKMEVADKSVSLELLIRSSISLGATTVEIGKLISAASPVKVSSGLKGRVKSKKVTTV